MIADGLIFIDEKNGKKLIFNYFSFCEIVKGCMIKYAHKSYEEADTLINNSHLIEIKPESYLDVALLSHEYQYHWAMSIALGEDYWQHLEYKNRLPEDYAEWESSYIKEHHLKEEFFEFSH